MSISRLTGRHALVIALCGATIALAPAAASAADDAAINALRQEIADLRARVERLETDIKSGVAINPARVIQPVEGGWRAPRNWDLLTAGMSPDGVTEILGEAERVRVVSKFEFWQYGKGQVKFYLGRLKSWDKP